MRIVFIYFMYITFTCIVYTRELLYNIQINKLINYSSQCKTGNYYSRFIIIKVLELNFFFISILLIIIVLINFL